MANGPIGLLKPTDLQFVPVETNFQEILNDNLGQLGTGADGFDQIFNDAIGLASDAGTVLAALDGDLLSAAAVVPEFLTSAPADTALQLQPAAIAADSVLNDFTQSVAPTLTQPTAPTPAPAAPYTPPGGTAINSLPAMKVGDAALSVFIDNEQRVTGDPQCIRVTLKNGDASIFKAASVSTRAPNINAGSASIDTNWYLTVTPTKPGTFYAEVDERDNCGIGDDTLFYFKVTITSV